MAGRRRQKQKNEEQRPVVTDDFIYDDPKEQPHGDSDSFALNSDTPEEAVRKLRRSPRHAEKKNDAEPNNFDDNIFNTRDFGNFNLEIQFKTEDYKIETKIKKKK